MHTLFLERRTTKNRNQFNLAGQAADGGLEHRRGNLFFLEDKVCDLVVLVGDGVDQFRERSLGAFLVFGSDVFDLVIETFVGFGRPPIDHLLVDDVNHAFKTAGDRLAFGLGRTLAQRQENRERVRAQFRAHVVERIFKIRADAIHLVDERDARDFVFGRLTPDGLGLRLHARDAAEHGDRAVEHAHGALDLGGEINVTGRINDVDTMRNVVERLVNLVFARLDGLLRPEAGDGGGRDRDAALLFLLHPVGDRVAVIHVADLVDETGVKKNALGGGRLAGVNVRGNANVARPFHRILTARRVH